MSLLRTKEYIDIVDLNHFVTDQYGCAPLGSANSFHHMLSEAVGYPGQNAMAVFEVIDDEDEAPPVYKSVNTIFKRLIADGHLPDRYEFEIYVWW